MKTTIAAIMVSTGVAWFMAALTVLAPIVVPLLIVCGLLCVARGAIAARPWR